MLCRANASSVSQVGLDATTDSVVFSFTGGVSFCSGVGAPEVLGSEPKVTPPSLVYTPCDDTSRVNIDYHIELEGHYYSVPYALLHEHVDACLSATTVEVFHRGQRVAAHRRRPVRGQHTTDPAHMPKAHQRHLEWTPSRLIDWARTIGPQTAALVQAILADRPHPEQGYRSCLGILRLAKRYGPERLEAACTRAGAVEARSYRHVDSILKHGLDRLAPPLAPPPLTLTAVHEHVRGRDYYQ
jgi:hypothetical protein